jgi:hypothetical protein
MDALTIIEYFQFSNPLAIGTNPYTSEKCYRQAWIEVLIQDQLVIAAARAIDGCVTVCGAVDPGCGLAEGGICRKDDFHSIR